MTTRILIVSNSGVPDGYGRIADEIGLRLYKRGYHIMAASWRFDGLLPPIYNNTPLPYHVAALGDKHDPPGDLMKVINALMPDVVLGIQDFAPYHMQVFHDTRVDWSRIKRMLITPVDGVPIEPTWLDLIDHMDGAMTISEFGAAAFGKAGKSVDFLPVGVCLDTFRPKPETRMDTREKLGLKPDEFLFGMMAQNQGRKAITLQMKAFVMFLARHPKAKMLLDMDEGSMAGWHLPNVIRQQGWPADRFLYRSDAIKAGVTDLADRYNALDLHAVISHREGWGLPLIEAMACGVPNMAMDYCSGTEICGGGKGYLVNTTGYSVPGTWGGAEDMFPDLDHMVSLMVDAVTKPDERAAIARRGMEWARTRNWDAAADAVEATLRKAIER